MCILVWPEHIYKSVPHSSKMPQRTLLFISRRNQIWRLAGAAPDVRVWLWEFRSGHFQRRKAPRQTMPAACWPGLKEEEVGQLVPVLLKLTQISLCRYIFNSVSTVKRILGKAWPWKKKLGSLFHRNDTRKKPSSVTKFCPV